MQPKAQFSSQPGQNYDYCKVNFSDPKGKFWCLKQQKHRAQMIIQIVPKDSTHNAKKYTGHKQNVLKTEYCSITEINKYWQIRIIELLQNVHTRTDTHTNRDSSLNDCKAHNERCSRFRKLCTCNQMSPLVEEAQMRGYRHLGCVSVLCQSEIPMEI